MKRITLVLAAGMSAAQCQEFTSREQESPQGQGGSLRLNAGDYPNAVAIGDLNGDGRADVFVANSASNDGIVYLNLGNRVFRRAEGSPFWAGSLPADAVMADLDRDGRGDLVIANHETDLVTVLRGTGDGRFAPFPSSPVSTGSRPHLHSIAVADLDGDGAVDIAVESSDDDRVRVLFGRGDGGFAPVAAFAVGDLPYFRIRAADLDQDGRAELVVPNGRSGTLSILTGNGAGRLREVTGSPVRIARGEPMVVAIGDFDGDKKADIAVAHGGANSPVTILAGEGGGRYGTRMGTVSAGRDPTVLATGDFNGDGIDDLAVGGFSGSLVSLFLGSKTKPLEQRLTLQVGQRPNSVALGDLDGDGRADVVSANALDGDISIVFGYLPR